MRAAVSILGARVPPAGAGEHPSPRILLVLQLAGRGERSRFQLLFKFAVIVRAATHSSLKSFGSIWLYQSICLLRNSVLGIFVIVCSVLKGVLVPAPRSPRSRRPRRPRAPRTRSARALGSPRPRALGAPWFHRFIRITCYIQRTCHYMQRTIKWCTYHIKHHYIQRAIKWCTIIYSAPLNGAPLYIAHH